MKKIWIPVIIIFWIACGYVDYGYTLGSFTAKYPYMDNTPLAITMALGGPLALPASLIQSPDMPLVWQTTPLTYDQRLAIFLDEFPLLGKDYFDSRYAHL